MTRPMSQSLMNSHEHFCSSSTCDVTVVDVATIKPATRYGTYVCSGHDLPECQQCHELVNTMTITSTAHLRISTRGAPLLVQAPGASTRCKHAGVLRRERRRRRGGGAPSLRTIASLSSDRVHHF